MNFDKRLKALESKMQHTVRVEPNYRGFLVLHTLVCGKRFNEHGITEEHFNALTFPAGVLSWITERELSA